MITLLHKSPEVNGTSDRYLQSGVLSVRTIGGVIATPVDDKASYETAKGTDGQLCCLRECGKGQDITCSDQPIQYLKLLVSELFQGSNPLPNAACSKIVSRASYASILPSREVSRGTHGLAGPDQVKGLVSMVCNIKHQGIISWPRRTVLFC